MDLVTQVAIQLVFRSHVDGAGRLTNDVNEEYLFVVLSATSLSPIMGERFR